MRARRLVGWLVLLWPAAGLAAGPGGQLLEAVRRGDTAAVRALVEQGVDVTTPEGDGATALHWAAYADDVETADLLIRAGAGVDAANDLGVTPLWVAGANGSAEMVARLLGAGANPNIAPATGGTPLLRAVRTGNADAVEALLAAGADVDASEGYRGQNALMWAVTQRHAAVARLLSRAGRRPRGPYERVASARAHLLPGEQHRRERLQLDGAGRVHAVAVRGPAGRSSRRPGCCWRRGAQVDVATPAGTTALVVAAHSGHGALAALLLENGADPERRRRRLHGPARRGPARRSPDLARALLAHGANPNARLLRGSPARRAAADFAFNKQWLGATPLWLAAAFHQLRAHGRPGRRRRRSAVAEE